MPDIVKIDSETQHRIEKSDKAFRITFVGSLLLFIAMLALIMVQNQINANRAFDLAAHNVDVGREQAAANHKRTQEYILCVAKALSVQIPDRTLEQCTQTVDNKTKAVN